jgi:hypothetical protein
MAAPRSTMKSQGAAKRLAEAFELFATFEEAHRRAGGNMRVVLGPTSRLTVVSSGS